MAEHPEESESPESPRGTYRHCQACGMFVPRDSDPCPECGARSDDEALPLHRMSRGSPWLVLVLVLVLGLALALLSRNRDAMREQESARLSLLRVDHLQEEFPPEKPVAPTPVPRPTPRPTRPPRPTPTPVPVVKPPTPIPVKATPTPVPVPTRASSLDLKDKLVAEYTQRLDESLPLYEKGQFVRLTLLNGRTVSGNLVQLDGQYLLLGHGGGQDRIAYRQLAPESRMRVDVGERNAYVEERALEEVLRRMQLPE